MLEKIVRFVLQQKLLVLLLIVFLVLFGAYSFEQLPIDAFPDISPVMVPVFAEAHGLAPEEVERFITYPIESAMNGLPGVRKVKSTSAFGMAAVYVYFEDDVDIYFARQIVSERLTEAMQDIPQSHEKPALGPITTGLGQIFMYYLTLDEGAPTEGMPRDVYLRTVNDWIVKFQLKTVKGVTDILSIGGHVLQFVVNLDPYLLVKYDLTVDDIVEAIQANNKNVGGQFLVKGAEEYLVRGLGLVSSIQDLENITVKTREGVPVLLRHVARVEIGRQIRRGVVTRNGQQEVISGIVIMLYGENTSRVIERLYRKLESVQKSLPEGVHIVPYYEQAELVQKATGTVKSALLVGGILVILVLFLFLGDVRSALIVAVALPLCMFLAFILMRYVGLSANLMSLGGLAIGIGMLVDASIVVAENIYRNLHANRQESRDRVALRATKEVGRPIIFALAIIVIVFLPLFSLQGVEGKMFKPMAFTISFALLGSLFVSLLVTPVLSALFMKSGGDRAENRLVAGLKSVYGRALRWNLKHKGVVLGTAVVLLAISLVLVPFLGTEFIPTLEEGSILLRVTMAPSTSLEQATATVMSLERKICKFPEVTEVISRIGRPEAGAHPHPVNYAEVHISLKPMNQWQSAGDKLELIERMEEALHDYPGVQLSFAQPIQNVFEELLAGVKAQLAVKVFGDDLRTLQQKAEEIRHAIEDIPGVADLSVEQSFGQPQVQIVVNRENCGRLGVNVDEVLEIVETAVGGEVVGQVYQGVRRFDIFVRMQEPFRQTEEDIARLYVHNFEGHLVPLSQVADIREVMGPVQINRENNLRRWMVQCNIRGRDLGSVVRDIRRTIDEKVVLPAGYFVEFGGQFENQQRAMTRLMIIIPLTLLLIFVMLYTSFGTLRHAGLILLSIPLALIGGVFALWLSGQYLSVPASVGFIALFGICVENSIVMVAYINELREQGLALQQALFEGALLRLRPVLMTALTTMLGLFPLLISRGIGAEVQRPLATVVVGGLLTSTFLTLFVLPALFELFERKRRSAGPETLD